MYLGTTVLFLYWTTSGHAACTLWGFVEQWRVCAFVGMGEGRRVTLLRCQVGFIGFRGWVRDGEETYGKQHEKLNGHLVVPSPRV